MFFNLRRWNSFIKYLQTNLDILMVVYRKIVVFWGVFLCNLTDTIFLKYFYVWMF
jgi:hypothetical protein